MFIHFNYGKVIMSDIQKIKDIFYKEFYNKPIIIRSPGRVNLIGEHTDYNDGFVLPAAIDKNIIFAIAPGDDKKCNLIAADLDDRYQFTIDDIHKSKKNWANYLIGIVDQLIKAGYKFNGFDCVFGGDIPIGAGLSSSAAIEAGLAFALNEIFSLGIPRLDLVKYAQNAENEFVGVRCGIMDQYVNIYGEENKVLKIDCRTLEYKYYPFELNGMRIVLCDTKVEHSLASSEYNKRRLQCEEGVKILSEFDENIGSLRDVNLSFLLGHKNDLPFEVYNRCIYVVKENERVNLACQDLEKSDFVAFGKRMFETHEGLQKEYEVSCKELDVLVDIASKQEGLIGSRMMGGGFGGCTINLVKLESLNKFVEEILSQYEKIFGIKPDIYIAKIVTGTEVVKQF